MKLFSKKPAAPDEALEALRGEYQNYRRRTTAQLERAEADGMKKAVLALLGVICLGCGIGMETISKWGPWMDLVSIYIIPIGATLGAVSWFYVMKKDDLLTAVNTGSHKTRGALWYSVGRYVYVPLALVLCLVALIGGVAF